jgi:hypothetical protein
MRLVLLAMALSVTSACGGKVTKMEEKAIRAVSLPLNTVVLRVKVKAVEATDWFDPSQCDDASDCLPQYFWYRYHARVIERISGAWRTQEVAFLHSQHAKFDRRTTDDCYVVLEPATNLEPQLRCLSSPQKSTRVATGHTMRRLEHC